MSEIFCSPIDCGTENSGAMKSLGGEIVMISGWDSCGKTAGLQDVPLSASLHHCITMVSVPSTCTNNVGF